MLPGQDYISNATKQNTKYTRFGGSRLCSCHFLRSEYSLERDCELPSQNHALLAFAAYKRPAVAVVAFLFFSPNFHPP